MKIVKTIRMENVHRRTVRIPKDLDGKLKKEAQKQGVSENLLIVTLIAEKLKVSISDY